MRLAFCTGSKTGKQNGEKHSFNSANNKSGTKPHWQVAWGRQERLPMPEGVNNATLLDSVVNKAAVSASRPHGHLSSSWVKGSVHHDNDDKNEGRVT